LDYTYSYPAHDLCWARVGLILGLTIAQKRGGLFFTLLVKDELRVQNHKFKLKSFIFSYNGRDSVGGVTKNLNKETIFIEIATSSTKLKDQRSGAILEKVLYCVIDLTVEIESFSTV
jgi:hypothetical protein